MAAVSQLAGDPGPLPGIGRSTAAAIAAFAWGHRAAILDGNVKRVLPLFCRRGVSRLSGGASPPVGLGRVLLPGADCGRYAQALMDLGPRSVSAVTRPRTLSAYCGLRWRALAG